MKCVICKNGELKPGVTSLLIEKKTDSEEGDEYDQKCDGRGKRRGI